MRRDDRRTFSARNGRRLTRRADLFRRAWTCYEIDGRRR